jgi:cysteine-rich repeat protein
MTFWSVVKVASSNTVHFSGTNPQTMRLHLPLAKGQEKIIVKIYYQSSMRLQVYVGPSFVEDVNKLDGKSKAQLVIDGKLSGNNAAGGYTDQHVHLEDSCNIGTVTAAKFKCMTPSNVHGSNRFDRSEGMLEIVVAAHDPDSFIEIRSMPVVSVSMGVSTSVDNFYKVKDSFLSSLAFTLGIDVNRITIVDVVAGNARRQAIPSIPSHASDRSLLSSRNLLAASTTVKFEVEPSPQIDLNTGDITVLEDVEIVNIILVRSLNIIGKCGVAFTVTNRSADSAVPGENFQTDSGFVTFESKEVTKSIEVQVLKQPGYTASILRFTVTLTEAVNSSLGSARSINVHIQNVHMPSPPSPQLASTGTTQTGVMLQWHPATWLTAPDPMYNKTTAWEVECISRGLTLPIISVPASFFKSYLGGMTTYSKVLCRSRANSYGGFSSWSPWSADVYTLTECGDGLRQGSEECDDGNGVSLDGCSSNCIVEAGFACSKASSGDVCSNGCRNGTREVKEGCDDGNNIAGDGCDTKCDVERAWQCADTVHGSIPHAVVSNCVVPCGDGIRLDRIEGCDDRNEEDGDGCSSSCVVEANSSCVEDAAGVSTCQTCGNGILEGTEFCDNGQDVACISCKSVLLGWRCSTAICWQGPAKLVEPPVLSTEEETSILAEWISADGFGLPIVQYDVLILNATSTAVVRTTAVGNSQPSAGEMSTYLTNLTASTVYRIRVRGCTVQNCGPFSEPSFARTTTDRATSLEDIGERIQEAAETAASSSGNFTVVEGTMTVRKAPPQPVAPDETPPVNETLLEIFRVQASENSISKQLSLRASLTGGFAIGFASSSLFNRTVEEGSGSISLDVQLVRKSDGAVDHDGSEDSMLVHWEALASGSNSILAPNDLAAVSGFVFFAPCEVNKSFTLVVSDNNDVNFGKSDKQFRVILKSATYSVVDGRDSVWFTITNDDEAASNVSITPIVNILVGSPAFVNVTRSGWLLGALRLTFSLSDDTAQLNTDYSASSLHILIAAGNSLSSLRIDTQEVGRFSTVKFRVILISVESECIAGDAAFECQGHIVPGQDTAVVSIIVVQSALAACGDCSFYVIQRELRRSGTCNTAVAPCNETLNLRGSPLASISRVSEGVFQGLHALISIDLSNNELTNLSTGIFRDLSCLVSLNLSSNKFDQIPAGVLSRLSGSANVATNVYLDKNPISSVPELVAKEIKAAKLYLRGTSLGCLPDFPGVGSANITSDVPACPASCTAGTYYVPDALTCSDCPFDTYMGGLGASTCVPCPELCVSRQLGSTSLDHCKSTMASGTPALVKLQLSMPMTASEFRAQQALFVDAIAAAAGPSVTSKDVIIKSVTEVSRRLRRLLASAVEVEVEITTQDAGPVIRELRMDQLTQALTSKGLPVPSFFAVSATTACLPGTYLANFSLINVQQGKPSTSLCVAITFETSL